ncbi:helix-turn-helix domain-containing protein [Desulfobulbus sp.]|uniref:helix-turn-helix domain-containing protein n=1 Tax=Desulfobulbus sp. TaxID=895 RepID=UPI0027BA6D05|nr:helix-turn-helix domain-containing protein [Desulfobulbus sp.]
MTDNNFLISRIKILIDGKSNREFAAECGISEGVVRKILKGEDPTLTTLKKVAFAKRIELWWFFTDQKPGDEQRKKAEIIEGNAFFTRRVSDHQPTAIQENLRWVVEWMNKYYGEHPSQSMYLYEDLKDRYSSFREFVEKKRASGDPQAGLPGELSVNDKG